MQFHSQILHKHNQTFEKASAVLDHDESPLYDKSLTNNGPLTATLKSSVLTSPDRESAAKAAHADTPFEHSQVALTDIEAIPAV